MRRKRRSIKRKKVVDKCELFIAIAIEGGGWWLHGAGEDPRGSGWGGD